MNILLLSHGINKKYNDNYYAYSHMCNLGDNILAITQRENINKGNRFERSPDFECEGNLFIYRLFDTVKKQKSIISNILIYYKIKKIVSKFKPDIIFCEELGNMMLAIKLKKEFNIPIVLRVEFLFDKNHLAYKNCEQQTKLAMQNNIEKIFVDNAFTLDWEIEPYFKLAHLFNYTIFVITVENYHNNKNIHQVSDEQLVKMASKYKVKLM